MEKKKKIALFGSVKVLVFAAFLCAVSGVMKLIAPSADTWRISFENFPILFAGISLGPIIGGAVGIASDLLGCLFRGYAINPLITLASMFVGVISGATFKVLKSQKKEVAIITAVFLGHIICNMVIKTIVLSKMFGMALEVLIPERTVTYLMTAVVESIIIVVLYRNSAIKNGLKRVTGNEY